VLQGAVRSNLDAGAQVALRSGDEVSERLTTAGAPATSRGADLGCGIGSNSQVSVGVARLRAASGDTDAGGLSGKTRLWQASSDAGRALLLAWGLSAQRDAQAAAGTGGWKTTEQAVTLVGSQTMCDRARLLALGIKLGF
jgi:hypothetical protein